MKDLTKAVVFDWGGIVESHENDLHDIRAAMCRALGRMGREITVAELKELWPRDGEHGIHLGTVNDRETILRWWSIVCDRLGVRGSVDDYVRYIEEEGRQIKYYEEVAQFARSLNARCVNAILSVLGFTSRKRIDEQYHLAAFDHVYLSFELGMVKPDPRLFDYVQKDLGIKPNNILLIDDFIENVEAARSCGWQAAQCFGTKPQGIYDAVNSFLG